MTDAKTVLIVGAGPGLSASIARRFSSEGFRVALAARNIEKLTKICEETGSKAYKCDASVPKEMEILFETVGNQIGEPNLAIYNASNRVRGPITDIDPEAVLRAITISCYGGFLMAQQAAKRMLKKGSGAIFFTGASAGVKGYPNSTTFAMGKFGLRGLAQALARELHPQNIHIGHFVIDGGISKGPDDPRNDRGPDGLLDPNSIAENYWQFWKQPRDSWAWETELRPWKEKF
ncbi:MAG: SDR family NAD(P)-dependent oxidoreductase [Rhodospirillaceae bacterium]|jgi:NAD(P)-dependent dehydrogenase (short-subunit alcohol dehydrogenase family)